MMKAYDSFLRNYPQGRSIASCYADIGIACKIVDKIAQGEDQSASWQDGELYGYGADALNVHADRSNNVMTVEMIIHVLDATDLGNLSRVIAAAKSFRIIKVKNADRFAMAFDFPLPDSVINCE